MDSPFERIDNALAQYYTDRGRNDYYNSNGIGKFMKFVVENQFEKTQLGDNVMAKDCCFTKIDDNFPLENDEKGQEQQQICYVIQHCHKYGRPPMFNENPAKSYLTNFDEIKNTKIDGCDCVTLLHVVSKCIDESENQLINHKNELIKCLFSNRIDGMQFWDKYPTDHDFSSAIIASLPLHKSSALIHKELYALYSSIKQFDVTQFFENNSIYECDIKPCPYLAILKETIREHQYFSYSENNKLDRERMVLIIDCANHAMDYHDKDFENIYNDLPSCSLKDCEIFKNNYRDRNSDTESELYKTDEKVSYQQLLDKLHCYYLHTFDIGRRLTTQDREQFGDVFPSKIDEFEDDEFEDDEFERSLIQQSTEKLIILLEFLKEKHELYAKYSEENRDQTRFIINSFGDSDSSDIKLQ
eukprot:321031_1